MSVERNFTDQDYELLSAYIDDDLSRSEREALEARLQGDVRLQRELDSLRQTVRLINQLPVLRAPRDFTLDASMVSVTPARNVRLFPAAFSALSAAAAILLFMFGGYFLLRENSMNTASMVVNQAPIIAAAPTAQATFSFTPSTADQPENEAVMGEIAQPQATADEVAMRSMLEPEGTQLAGAGMDEAAASAAEAEADPSAMSDMALEELAPMDAQMDAEAPAAGGSFPQSELFAAEADPDEEADLKIETQTADAGLMMQQALEETEESTALSATGAAAAAPVPAAEPVAIAPAETPAAPDDRLLGLSLMAAGALLLGLAVVLFLYRRRVRA